MVCLGVAAPIVSHGYRGGILDGVVDQSAAGQQTPVECARAYLERIGVERLLPLTSPFDPGYDSATLESHLAQSAHLMASLKISMSCWMIASGSATRAKIAAARAAGVPVVAGGGPFEIAVAQGALEPYLDLCSEIGFDRIECASGFTSMPVPAVRAVQMARDRGLGVQFELGQKHDEAFTGDEVERLVAQGTEWLEAGAEQVVIEARESALNVGLFGASGELDARLAERLATAFGLDRAIFEAPTKPSQFALLDLLGNRVQLCNVRLEELLRVEIYRRGLHSDAFLVEKLRPRRPDAAEAPGTP
jgi:phosphosulfolactate synthase